MKDHDINNNEIRHNTIHFIKWIPNRIKCYATATKLSHSLTPLHQTTLLPQPLIIPLISIQFNSINQSSNQLRKPVCCQTAFRTRRRSLPFNVRPAPSNTEQATLSDLLATISCGGRNTSFSSSSSSSTSSYSSPKNPPLLLLKLASTGTFTGADW